MDSGPYFVHGDCIVYGELERVRYKDKELSGESGRCCDCRLVPSNQNPPFALCVCVQSPAALPVCHKTARMHGWPTEPEEHVFGSQNNNSGNIFFGCRQALFLLLCSTWLPRSAVVSVPSLHLPSSLHPHYTHSVLLLLLQMLLHVHRDHNGY